MAQSNFNPVEATIDDIHAAYKSGELTCRQLVQMYLDRIAAYDKKGPAINAIITVNADALKEADRLDAAYKSSGPVGPLHGIPVIVKDQADVNAMPTTLGSLLFKDYYPDRDSFVVDKLKKAGAIILGKATLGELGGGDTHGSLFGSTRNPYDLERTAGGSSGGSAPASSANFCTVAVGQEGFASIRRPSTWNCVSGMRPTAGLVSRGGVYGGWPIRYGSLGPMARTVSDLAKLLDTMVGYDPDDPVTARGVGQTPDSFTKFLDRDGLKGARIGILRESMGLNAEPDSEDFKKIPEVFDKARGRSQSRRRGDRRSDRHSQDESAPRQTRRRSRRMRHRSGNITAAAASRPSRRRRKRSPAAGLPQSRQRLARTLVAHSRREHYESLKRAEELMTNFLQVMAEHRLDAIVHKAVEHQPTLIKDGINPPFVDQKGAPHLNTFLVYVPTIRCRRASRATICRRASALSAVPTTTAT